VRFLVRVENEFEVEAENEEEARVQALHQMAFGTASMAEAYVSNVEPLDGSGAK
jgi:GTP-sensing pleiotropic transcriptional regulator CodY